MAEESDNGPLSQQTANAFENKPLSKYYDPCQEAASRSIKCMQRNGGDRALCQDYFQAYRECKKQWLEARKRGTWLQQ